MTNAGDDEAIVVRRRDFGGIAALEVQWDFHTRGGTFGEAEATTFAAACADAAVTATPLVTRLRSGGTRLQEGMHALVGIPRAVLALRQLASAHVPHICVAEHPTTGGVWVAVGATADLRAGVRGATVGFSGPRVVEALTGQRLPPGANTADRAAEVGLLDALVDADGVDGWVAGALAVLAPDRPTPVDVPEPLGVPSRHGWAQVQHSRTTTRPSGAELVGALAPGGVELRGGDGSVAATVTRLAGRRCVVVAVASSRAARVTPAGYALLARAAELASRLGCALVTLVDTAGADPLPASEEGGIAAAIAAAMDAVLDCAAPTVAVVHGEGGSGGALAAAVCDAVGVGPDGWFAALHPDGAAAALRVAPAAAAELMHVAPADLVANGFADAVVPTDARLVPWLADTVDRLRAEDAARRVERRLRRWAGPLRAT